MPFVEPHSVCSFPIKLFYNAYQLGLATGFLWRNSNEVYLVSNWHVLSGRRTDTGQPNSKTMLIPNKVAIRLHDVELGKTIEEQWIDLQDSDGNSLWLQHGEGQDQDVAAIRLNSDILKNTQTLAIQDLESDPIRLRAGLPTFTLGFPKGLMAQGAFPVWKSGFIAAEPAVAREDGQQFYLIDGASREGMSGAPVFAVGHGVFQDHFGNNVVGKSRATKFIGIYSGRYATPVETELQLVRAWPRAAIEQMFIDQVRGSFELRQTNS